MTDLSSEEFRQYGDEVVDWIATYLAGLRELAVLPDVVPGETAARLQRSGPEHAEPLALILDDFRSIIVPATTHWNHPRFFAYFSVSASAAGILAEALTAALNVNGMVWKSSPAFTELETTVIDWVRQWLGLPDQFFGVMYDTASVSTMHALAAAREFVDPESRTRGMRGDLTVYTSEQAHSSVEKGAIALGFGQNNVRKVPVDSAFRMIPSELSRLMAEDAAAGRKPCCVVPTVGTTSTTSIDPVRETVNVAAPYGAWIHIDGAYGGCAAILPELQSILDGTAEAHSLVVNPHKWFFTPIDCSLLFTARPDVLKRAFSLVPEYLKTAQDADAVNLMDYGVPLGRRFRSLKLWFVLRSFGRQGMASIIRSHIEMAREFAAAVETDERFEVCAPVPLSLVCFRLRASDEANRELLDRINRTGVAFLSHTVLHNRFVLRLALGNLRTTREDIALTWDTSRQQAEGLI
ncbi:MAG TPA: pyridoxal-dependent decarboxylase [Bryobacteraceae bacterium]|nr:pyridoxal-dependent decarboxylase [Bryobacteraceae bacterium]